MPGCRATPWFYLALRVLSAGSRRAGMSPSKRVAEAANLRGRSSKILGKVTISRPGGETLEWCSGSESQRGPLESRRDRALHGALDAAGALRIVRFQPACRGVRARGPLPGGTRLCAF